jgi:serine phosphatase RsbU (regulator of sigma subunit)
MSEAAVALSGKPTLDVTSPDRSRRTVEISETPFFIGRGGDSGNHLQLADPRISRQCATIHVVSGAYQLEDRGHRGGIFVNGKKTDRRSLESGDKITFGFADSYEIVFHTTSAEASIQGMLTRIASTELGTAGLGKLNLLLEATSLLHSDLPLDSVLGTMLDHAITVTNADRGLLLEGDSQGALRVRLARSKGNIELPVQGLSPSQTAVRQALERRGSVITEDLNRADASLQGAQSIVVQALRAVVAIPLYATSRSSHTGSSSGAEHGQLLGVLYLDSRRVAAFSKVDRQILDALAVEAASILDNARLVERERQRRRMEQELNIARDIQQALLPRGFRNFPHCAVTGIHTPCHAVGGDYYDVFPMGDDRTAILVADVSGKGIGAALLTTMLQGALSGMTNATNPVEVFAHLNRFLCEHSDVERYATMFLGILDQGGHLEFVNAGHPSPLVLRRGEVSELIQGGSFPVGLVPEAEYQSATANLEPEDTLVLFSDGVTEAMDPDEQLFGVPRLMDVLTGQRDTALDRLQEAVLKSIGNFTRGASQADDITLLLVRYRVAQTP